MSEPFVFDPRCDLCKEPFGAVPCGTAVTFHCRPLATEGFSHCALVLSCEFSGTQREQELPLGPGRPGPAGVVHPAGCPAECVSSPAVRHHLLALHRRSFVDFCPAER